LQLDSDSLHSLQMMIFAVYWDISCTRDDRFALKNVIRDCHRISRRIYHPSQAALKRKIGYRLELPAGRA
jgi:hypothetical protein